MGQVDHRIAGYVVWNCNHKKSVGTVMNLAVDGGFRRRGIGERLLTHALDNMREKGLRMCQLQVRESSRSARALYEKVGMSVMRRLPRYYTDEDGLLYETSLDTGITSGSGNE